MDTKYKMSGLEIIQMSDLGIFDRTAMKPVHCVWTAVNFVFYLYSAE